MTGSEIDVFFSGSWVSPGSDFIFHSCFVVLETHLSQAAHDLSALILLLLFFRIAQLRILRHGLAGLLRASKPRVGAPELVISLGQVRGELDDMLKFGGGL